jgi:hypothetical protein
MIEFAQWVTVVASSPAFAVVLIVVMTIALVHIFGRIRMAERRRKRK